MVWCRWFSFIYFSFTYCRILLNLAGVVNKNNDGMDCKIISSVWIGKFSLQKIYLKSGQEIQFDKILSKNFRFKQSCNNCSIGYWQECLRRGNSKRFITRLSYEKCGTFTLNDNLMYPQVRQMSVPVHKIQKATTKTRKKGGKGVIGLGDIPSLCRCPLKLTYTTQPRPILFASCQLVV